jgi:uncharacterized membrane protein (DUF4010 family)
VLATAVLGGLLSSTAATLLYARRSRESPAMEKLALAVVPLTNLVPLVRVGFIAAVVASALLPSLVPVLGAALAAGVGVAAFFMRGLESGDAPVAESRNPAEMGAALRFAALYAVVLLASAWLSDLAGERGLYAAALASGMVDIDPIMLSALQLFNNGGASARVAVAAIALAYLANVAFKLSVLFWFNWRLGLRALWPLLATVAAGGAAFFLGHA